MRNGYGKMVIDSNMPLYNHLPLIKTMMHKISSFLKLPD